MPDDVRDHRWSVKSLAVRVATLFAVSLVLTLVVAWLPALGLLRYGVISHDGAWASNVIHDHNGSGRDLRFERSTIPLSDWVKVFPQPLHYSGQITSVQPVLPGWARVPPVGSAYSRVDTAACGWPLRCLTSECWVRNDENGRTVEELRHNIRLMEIANRRIFLPLGPIWTGIAGNVAIFGVGSAVVWFVPASFRRWRRRRAGACAFCGYVLSGSTTPVCPECGRKRDGFTQLHVRNQGFERSQQ